MTLSDYRRAVDQGQSVAYFSQVASASEYYPFGMLLTKGNYSSGGYRFGFNGQEKDDEIYGNGNSMTAKFWQYDARLGRRWNIDPVVKEFESPYACFANNPIWLIDPNGADTIVDPNGNKINVGDNYHTYENSGEHYLIGFGLKTKIWDPNIDVGTDQNGAYVDFNHEDRGFDFTGYMQFEGRGSAVITGSYAIGIAFSPTDGTATIYKTWSAGIGPTFGAHYGLTLGFMVDAAADEMAGHGLNFGVHAVIPAIPGVIAINLSGEINTSFSADYEFLGIGACSGIPVSPLLNNGLSLGAYVDYSNMDIVKSGDVYEMIDYFWSEVNRMRKSGLEARMRAREINTSNGVYWGVKHDFPW